MTMSIDIILASNTDQREQRVTPGIGQCRPHAMGRCRFADATYRPIRRNPFAGRMRQDRAEPDDAGIVVDGSGLHGGDLMLA